MFVVNLTPIKFLISTRKKHLRSVVLEINRQQIANRSSDWCLVDVLKRGPTVCCYLTRSHAGRITFSVRLGVFVFKSTIEPSFFLHLVCEH